MVKISNKRDPLLYSRLRQPDGDSIQQEDQGEDSVVEHKESYHSPLKDDWNLHKQKVNGDRQRNAVEWRATQDNTCKRNGQN